MQLAILDWIIIGAYLIGMIVLSIYLSKNQKNEKDYYLGGNSTGPWPIAISTMATQCSTNSILGAPAFVAFSIGGGLLWLQYEIAVPLAMIVLMIFLLPLYRRLNIISVYSYLEKRFGPGTRSVVSIMFQFLRAFSTGVTVYGISRVIEYCTGVPFYLAVLLLGFITVVYDSIGGMKAVIWSDVIQMVVLYGAILVTIFVAISLCGGAFETISLFKTYDPTRFNAIDFGHTGFDGKTYAFWPMLLGGLFLYVSYYGCDQTQVQRELSTKNIDDTNYSLFLNGMLRFPLVITYCFLGVCIGAYVYKHPEFIKLLPLADSGRPDFNLAVPVFVIKYFPVGVVGLFIVGLFSAAMSSLDSTINSLSATTMQDVLKGQMKLQLSTKQELIYSKLLTVFWGTLCTIFAFFVGGISDSIIVSINKIGSLANGPILALFMMGVLTRNVNGIGAVVGLLVGIILNGILWIYAPSISWLWWNVIGFVVTCSLGSIISIIFQTNNNNNLNELVWLKDGKQRDLGLKKDWKNYYYILGSYSIIILIILCLIGIH